MSFFNLKETANLIWNLSETKSRSKKCTPICMASNSFPWTTYMQKTFVRYCESGERYLNSERLAVFKLGINRLICDMGVTKKTYPEELWLSFTSFFSTGALPFPFGGLGVFLNGVCSLVFEVFKTKLESPVRYTKNRRKTIAFVYCNVQQSPPICSSLVFLTFLEKLFFMRIKVL